MTTQQHEDVAEPSSVVRPDVRVSATVLGWLLAVGGAVGLLAAFILSVERITLLEHPSEKLSCDLNPLVSCGQVMDSWQGELFGFPNPFLGVAVFPIVVTIGVAVLAGAQLARWIWLGLWVGTLGGAVFVTWLFTQSVYVIEKLCPYCMVVWAVTIPIFVYTTGYVVSEGHLRVPPALRRAVVENRGLIVTVWYLIIAALITVAFWDRWYLVF